MRSRSMSVLIRIEVTVSPAAAGSTALAYSIAPRRVAQQDAAQHVHVPEQFAQSPASLAQATALPHRVCAGSLAQHRA